MKQTLIGLAVILLLLPLQIMSQDRALTKKLKTLDTYCETAMSKFEVPGMAIAVVKDGAVIFSKGYGVRTVDHPELVDENTLFAIASNSKSFTSAALAILVDRGEISWDDPVQKYLPWFQLYDPYVSANMTIRDLLTHRSGLKTFAGDLVWFCSSYNRKEVVERARFLEPTYGFRTTFGYSNILYLAAGLVVEEVSGMSWDQFIDQELFTPVEMNSSLTSVTALTPEMNVASPHSTKHNKVVAIPWQNWDNIAPAGGIISNVKEMSNWMILQLNNGIWETTDTIFSPERSYEMWSEQTIQTIHPNRITKARSTNFNGYALGWGVKNCYGKKIVSHSGGYDGMLSMTTLIPEENLGIVVLTNQLEPLYYAISEKAVDIFLNDGEGEDWAELLKPRAERKIQPAVKQKNDPPSLPLEAYCGTFSGALYGDAIVTLIDSTLRVDLIPTAGFESFLTHKHLNTFAIEMEGFTSLPEGELNFTLDADGNVDRMEINIPNPDFDFTELTFNKK